MGCTKVVVVASLLCVWVQLCSCKAVGEESAVEVNSKEVEDVALRSSKALETTSEDDDISEISVHGEPEIGTGRKLKKKKPKLKLKKSKKFLKKFLPFLLIPLLIQAKLIPLFLFKLKLIALKALGVGKLALLLIAINVIYNTMHRAQDGDQQYSQEVLASEHYGYNGGPEYGAWVN